MVHVDEELIKEFLLRSYTGEWEDFDFKELLEQLIDLLDYVLAVHGLLGYDKFRDVWVEYWEASSPMSLEELLSIFTIQNPYLYIGPEDILDAIAEYEYNIFKNTYENMHPFTEIKKVYDELVRLYVHGGSLSDYIIAIDKAIHLQHAYGSILQDYGGVDIEEIKEEVEYEIELMEEEKRKRQEAWEMAYKGRWSE